MLDSIFSSLSGLNTASRKLQVSSNNLANVQTPGFKASRTNIVDNQSGGARVAAVQRLNTSGSFLPTGNALDVAIQGNGFLQVTLGTGGTGFTRAGSLKVDSTGRLVNSNGNPILPQINVPGGAESISISSTGTVSASVNGQVQTLGQIQLATFQNPSGLNSLGNNLFGQSAASGAPIVSNPGAGGAGTMQSGFLETSNVDITEEMVQQILAGNAFKANANAIRAADEMTGTILDIKA